MSSYTTPLLQQGSDTAQDARHLVLYLLSPLQVLIFSVESRHCILKLAGHSRRVACCDFSPDGVLLVTSSDDTTAILWNSHSGQAVLCLK